MKFKRFSFFSMLILVSIVTLSVFLPNGMAQDYTRMSLPEGAKARLGKGIISDIAYSPDGRRLAVSGSIGVWIHDAQSGKALSLITGDTSYVNSVSFAPDGKTLATGSGDGTILLWDALTGAPVPEQLTVDINGDGVVNIQDLVRVASRIGQDVPAGGDPADVNGDGIINIQDLVQVAGAIGK